MVESLLLTCVQISTRAGDAVLTHATGFFFERGEELFLVTSRHVFIDETTNHHPDSVNIELHVNPDNIAETQTVNLSLFDGSRVLWREVNDAGGLVDIAVRPIQHGELPETALYRAFTPMHLLEQLDEVEVGTPLLVVGFPLGFHDTLHRLAVARQAIIASAFGLRFQGTGCFLTDGRTHRGISGAPVVARVSDRRGRTGLPFVLLGVHASRIDVGTRDEGQDESLGLNSAWYADSLVALTEPTEAAEEASKESPSSVSGPNGIESNPTALKDHATARSNQLPAGTAVKQSGGVA